MAAPDLYTAPAAMEPMFPTDPDGELEALAIDLVAKAARLSEAMHPITRAAVAELVRPMNSYYSNLIEGHDTHPIDIARALKQEYALDKKKKDLQLEAIAHIEVSAALANGRLPGLAGLDPSSAQFLKGVHKAFYDHLPESFKTVTSEEGEARTVVPGAWRTGEVKVGRHIAPAHGSVPAFIERFSAFYDRDAATNRSMVRRIIALAAAHHRLAWIHPFLDGNGRVVRLCSDAWLRSEGLDGVGLWSISRGLARSRSTYTSALAQADLPRRNSHDGRGHLSNEALVAFCRYFLRTAIDQVEFMHASLQLDDLLHRIDSFVDRMMDERGMRTETRHVLQAVFLRGSITKPEAERLMGVSDKTGKKVTDELVRMGLLLAHREKQGVAVVFSAAYPIPISPWILPGLYPDGKEAQMMAARWPTAPPAE